MPAANTRALALLSTVCLLAATSAFAADRAQTAPAAETPVAAQPAGYEPGEKWRTKMSMSMMGMSMPGMSSEVCVPKDSDEAPVAMDKNCQTFDHKRVGNKFSFRMVCTGKNAMEGTMEMVYEGRDRYRGKMLAKTADGEMTMDYEGERLPGECDAAALKRSIDAMQARAEQQTAKTCEEAARAGNAGMFIGTQPPCPDPKHRQIFCGTAQGYRGFGALSQQERAAAHGAAMPVESKVLTATARTCGFGVEALRARLCGAAEAKGEWEFLASECPVQAAPLAQRECAGRSFTTPVAQKYQDFCAAYASGHSQAARSADEPGSNAYAGGAGTVGAAGASEEPGQTGKADAEEEEQKKSAGERARDSLKKGTDKLKGLFGR